MRAVSRILLLAAVGITVGACGGGAGNQQAAGTFPTETGTTTPAPPPCPSAGAKRASGTQAGTVGKVLSHRACLDGVRVGGGELIAARAIVSTDHAGLVEVALEVKFDHCWVLSAAAVQVAPPSGRALDIPRGAISCSTDPDADFEVTVKAGSAEIDVLDPVFSIMVEERRTRVSVAHGFVRVRSAQTGSGRAVLVGPGLQVLVPENQEPSLEPFDLRAIPKLEAESLRDLLGKLPKRPVGAPDPAGSNTLERILHEGLVVALDEAALDAQSRGFSTDLFAALGKDWGVRTRFLSIRVDTASDVLVGGRADAVLSPERVEGARLTPLFSDSRERTWLLAVAAGEERLEAGLREFLVRELEGGAYGRLYKEKFGTPPAYAVIEPVVAP